MSVVYLIQTHANLPQIDKLVRKIRQCSPRSLLIVCHHRARFEIKSGHFDDIGGVVVRHVDVAHRGDFSLVEPHLDAIEWLLRERIQFDWIVNLTGQCYPLQPLQRFEAELSSGGHDAMMYCFDTSSNAHPKEWDDGEVKHRYHFRWFSLRAHALPNFVRLGLSVPRRILNGGQPWLRLDTSYGLRVGIRPGSQVFKNGFRCFGGWAFKALSRASAEYLVHFGKQNTDVYDHFRHTILPEEAYVQTVIANNSELRVFPKSFHYVDWTGGRLGHPRVLDISDFERMMASGAFFARKIDMARDPGLVERIDRHLAVAQDAA